MPSVTADAIVRGVTSYQASAAPSSASLELVFVADSCVGDGRFSNNAWMQELPDPVTKLTWDNAALMSPSTMASLGVANGEMVRIQSDGRSLDVPAWSVPGQSDSTIVLAAGYGRQLGGDQIADGCGFDAYQLRTSTAMSYATKVAVQRTGETYKLVSAQEHGSMEGRALFRENSAEGYRADPDFAPQMSPLAQAAALQGKTETEINKSLWDERDYTKGYQWGMVIDLASCNGCNACVVACTSENNIPMVGKEQVEVGREMFWNRMDRYFVSEDGNEADDPRMVQQMVPCMQCENAPCESVCPVQATVHSPEGLNDMAYNRCIGTRYCSNNCPYKVRRFNYLNFHKELTAVEELAHNPDVTVRSRGVMEKCTYCVQRINGGKFAAKSEGRSVRDGDIVPACAQGCPADAITFGDINDPESQVSKLRASSLNYGMLSELNVKPRTTYLAKVNNPNPELS